MPNEVVSKKKNSRRHGKKKQVTLNLWVCVCAWWPLQKRCEEFTFWHSSAQRIAKNFKLYWKQCDETERMNIANNWSDLLNIALHTTIILFVWKRRKRVIVRSETRKTLEKLLTLHAHKQQLQESLERLNFSLTSKFYLSASSFRVSKQLFFVISYLFCFVLFWSYLPLTLQFVAHFSVAFFSASKRL